VKEGTDDEASALPLTIRFREATNADQQTTRALVRAAFRDHEPEETATFLDALRADACILFEGLAEDDSGVLAHIVFSRVWVEEENGNRIEAAMLTPLAVHPDRQREGLGTNLMKFSLNALERRGESLFFVLGHPSYYPRVGFRSDLSAAVESPWSGKPSFMVRGAIVPTGKLLLPKSIADAH
jgi:putative acetyltransferase